MDYQSLKGDEVKELLPGIDVAILPLGAVEFHGEHLPLGTDNYLAEGISAKVAEKINKTIILPPIFYGQVWSTFAYSGTLTLSNETLAAIIKDIGLSLKKDGITILAIINTHMGNLVAMKEASRVLYEEGITVLYLTYPGSKEAGQGVLESTRVHANYFHACEIETSYMLYLAPEHVNMDRASSNIPDFPLEFDYTPTPWIEVTDSPVLGDPTLATPEKGKIIIEAVVNNIVKIINSVRENHSHKTSKN